MIRSPASVVLALSLVACGTGASVEPAADASPVVEDGAPVEASVDAELPDAIETTGPWNQKVELVGVGSAAGEGVLGPIYPMAVTASAEQLVVVGLAKASFTWGGVTYPAGGFVLAIEPATGRLQWHRKIGESVSGVAPIGPDLALVGDFSREIALEPTAGAPITLKAGGAAAIGSPSDGFVAVITRTGTFRWARRFGSTGYDHAFGVATSADAIAVTGAISGVADFGEGCSQKLEAAAGVDDGDGHLIGTKDAVVLRYGIDGSCPWGAVLGAPATNDMAMGVVLRDGALFVTGDAALPMRMRTTTGDDRDLGGPPSKWPSPFLVRLDAKGTKPSTWFFAEGARGGRGRALATRGADLLWALTVPGESNLLHDGVTTKRISAGGHVIALRGDAVLRVSDLGPTTLDIGSIAVSDTGAVVAGTEFEPHGVVLAKIDTKSTLLAHHRATAGYPFAAAALGNEVWLAGHSGIDLELGTPKTPIAVGPQGGFFVVHLPATSAAAGDTP